MANLDIITATVQQLLSQTTALLQQEGIVSIQDEILESLERDTRLAMMKLRRCRNDSIAVPINRLPPELLRIILGHVRHPPSTRYTSHLSASRFASYHPIVSTMLVCHKWHAIGSQAASLWTDIDFACQGAFAPVLLTRSLGAPIRLCGRLDGDNTLQKVITDHGERIRELDLWVGAGFSHPMPVLQSILAVDMPRVRVLSLSRKSSSVGEGPASVITDADTPASFPTLKAMLLQGFLLVPTHVLPQLTHLNLTRLDDVNPSSILKLLKNTPALEVLDVIQCREYTAPPNSAAPSSSVILLRLHSVYMWCLTSATVHDLMARLEAPSLASLRLSSIFAMSGALLSTPLIPRSLSTRTVNRLAFDLGGNFTSFHTVFHGNDLSLAMGINAIGVQDIERASWAFDDFPTILPLSGVEELHFQAQRWDFADGLLPHLAACMPMVSTLFVKHNERTSRDEDSDTDGLMDLAQVVAALLESDSPVLFPYLAHLELVVGDIPLGFCELLAPALARRDQDGRRLRRLRIWLDDAHAFRWTMKWMHQAEPDYKETAGIYEHVDSVKIGTKKKGRPASGDDEEPTNTVGWGEWRDCVQPARHDYW